ncbi:hypothetical protein B0T20DRAFT_128563 [Sordaria brevicollis]|uniref:Zn(2)-C6 fungal-type domain-containing protein n=1 Tax=Sordaria brevicollis TaxID=83679 RepID=A0AAE0PL93_SORBR|nr:hypothetical protein B0T20DRAFT_128563 [Sordaria brevicollis]
MATFTALNGASPRPAEVLNGAREPERGNGQSAGPDPRSANDVAISQRERDRENWGTSTRERRPYSATDYHDSEPAPKRMRADSVTHSPRREHRPSPVPTEPPPKFERTERTPIERPERYERTERMERPEVTEKSEPYEPSRPQSNPHDRYPSPQKEAYRASESRENEDRWRYQQARSERNPSYDAAYSAGPVSGQSEEPMAEHMRRATSQADSGDYDNQSPDGDENRYSDQYTPDQRRDGTVQSDPKKRKRNFSNRTKTGCLTCRRRKKKCDETKPQCTNCIKGSFECAGYPPQRNNWQKPESKPAQVNIESKDPTYVRPGAYGMPQQQQQPIPPYTANTAPILSQPKQREPFPMARAQQPTLRITPPQGRTLPSDDDRLTASTIPSASVISPDNKLSALSAHPSNFFPTPVSARTPLREYQRVPPLHDLTRTDPDHQPPPPPPPPQSAISAHPPFSFHGGRTETPTSAVQPPITSQPPASAVQATAQLALSHAQAHTPSSATVPNMRREKDEMVSGRAFYPFDKELVLERERCNAACWKFNNSTNPNIGVSPAERARLFREILHPREGVQLTPNVLSPIGRVGRVGENIAVEAPFNCDYGYNITIGNNVLISRNCLITDSCDVRIGNNVIISPNVSIYTNSCSKDWRHREGNRGPQYGKPVIIEDDVWICANVVLLPGVKIGRGATVGAGSVVSRDIAPFSVYLGRRSSMHRGIPA